MGSIHIKFYDHERDFPAPEEMPASFDLSKTADQQRLLSCSSELPLPTLITILCQPIDKQNRTLGHALAVRKPTLENQQNIHTYLHILEQIGKSHPNELLPLLSHMDEEGWKIGTLMIRCQKDPSVLIRYFKLLNTLPSEALSQILIKNLQIQELSFEGWTGFTHEWAVIEHDRENREVPEILANFLTLLRHLPLKHRAQAAYSLGLSEYIIGWKHHPQDFPIIEEYLALILSFKDSFPQVCSKIMSFNSYDQTLATQVIKYQRQYPELAHRYFALATQLDLKTRFRTFLFEHENDGNTVGHLLATYHAEDIPLVTTFLNLVKDFNFQEQKEILCARNHKGSTIGHIFASSKNPAITMAYLKHLRNIDDARIVTEILLSKENLGAFTVGDGILACQEESVVHEYLNLLDTLPISFLKEILSHRVFYVMGELHSANSYSLGESLLSRTSPHMTRYMALLAKIVAMDPENALLDILLYENKRGKTLGHFIMESEAEETILQYFTMLEKTALTSARTLFCALGYKENAGGLQLFSTRLKLQEMRTLLQDNKKIPHQQAILQVCQRVEIVSLLHFLIDYFAKQIDSFKGNDKLIRCWEYLQKFLGVTHPTEYQTIGLPPRSLIDHRFAAYIGYLPKTAAVIQIVQEAVFQSKFQALAQTLALKTATASSTTLLSQWETRKKIIPAIIFQQEEKTNTLPDMIQVNRQNTLGPKRIVEIQSDGRFEPTWILNTPIPAHPTPVLEPKKTFVFPAVPTHEPERSVLSEKKATFEKQKPPKIKAF